MLPLLDERPGGRLAENIVHFGRVLRAAGLPVGPGRVIEAIRAIEAVGIARRDDFYWALFSVLVNRRDQRELFDQAFHIFWRNPRLLERVLSVLLPSFGAPAAPENQPPRRLAEALYPGRGETREGPDEREIEIDARLTFSAEEVLREMDFESMSADELAEAKAVIARMRLAIMRVPTRRYTPHGRGPRIDMRATLRAGLRTGAEMAPLRRRDRTRRHPPLVILCDISGSMSRYSGMLLHFMHAVTNDRDRVHTFVFGTRLTNITRHLHQRDVDIAVEKVSGDVADWSGGTRIGACLRAFNREWSRRVLGQGAVVLLISDGLDRDAGEGLAGEADRLHRSCRRLIWLNPLLRYAEFEPKSLGVAAILPHVDEFRPVHNIESLTDLAKALAKEARSHREPWPGRPEAAA
jgi:uncharacterized protein with von Willebrand factor type A (vWA) domain